MSYIDYLDLRLAVGEATAHRDLTDVLPTLVKRAETRMNRDLRMRQQEADATITMTSGSGTLPTDYVEAKRVFSGSRTYIQGNREQIDAGSCSHYATNGSQLFLSGFSGDLSVRYYAKLPTLTTSVASTNWLLTDGPDLYLYAVCREVGQHVRNSDMRVSFDAEYHNALKELCRENHRSQWGDARVQVSGATP